jgi:phosphonate transport system substrate-binding protein
LPPSVGSREARERCEGLDRFLREATGVSVEVLVAPDYLQLAQLLCSGEYDAAWAPPFVCARVEAAGLKVLVRGRRDGHATYRAALVGRASSALRLGTLHGTVAAWVDRNSVGGYMLAAELLKAKKIELRNTFREQRFAGTYLAGLRSVADGTADVTSIFAPCGPDDAPVTATGVSEVASDLVSQLSVIAFTGESPNDGIAASRFAEPRVLDALSSALLAMNQAPEGRGLLQRAFRVDGFEVSPANGYKQLYRTAVATL